MYKLLIFLTLMVYSQLSISQSFKKGDIITLDIDVDIKDRLHTNQSYDIIQKEKTLIKTDSLGNPIFINGKTENRTIYFKSYQLNILEHGYKYKVASIKEKTITLIPLKFKIFTQNKFKKRNKRFGIINNRIIDKTLRSNLYNNKKFDISRKDFDDFAKKPAQIKDRLSIGLLSLPFKYRPQDDKSFDTEFNFNSTLNIRLRSVYSGDLYFQIGAGIGTVGLNDSNTNSESNNDQDVSTLTFLTGVMVQYKKAQVGFYIGVDQINNQQSYQWNSNGNIWFGFGIGYEIFKISLTNENNKNQ